jgi:hypothetical protein
MKTLKKMRFIPLLLALLLVVMMVVPTMSRAAGTDEPTVYLGNTANFAVLAGQEVTNDGTTTINGNISTGLGGDVGVSPGSSVTGFPPGLVSQGIIHRTDTTAGDAQFALGAAYDDAASRPVTQDLSGTDLGGLTLTPGVYSFSSEAQLTGKLTLDGQNKANPVFIFQIVSKLTTASISEVKLINGAIFCRIFWKVGSSATLGSDSIFKGHIFALQSITLNAGVTVTGQLLARNGAVTLISDIITNPVVCVTTSSSSGGGGSSSGSGGSSSSTAASSSSVTSSIASSSSIAPSSSVVSSRYANPKSGDNSMNMIIFLLALVSISVVTTFVIRKKVTNK